jgi:tRNA A37 threonylcarbamoyltransferase TsaD
VTSDLTIRCERQTATLHTDQRPAAAGNAVQQRFGGVPEVASRAHSEMIERVVWAALQEAARFRELAHHQALQG